MNKRTKNTLIFIIILAFALRLALFLYVIANGNFETWEYEEIAKNLASGAGFKNNYLGTTYYSCTTPLYPYMCAAFYKLFGVNHGAIAFIQVIFSTLACLVIFDIGRRICNPTVGLLASFLSAVHPGLIFYAVVKIHPFVFDSLLLSLSLWAFLYLKEGLSIKRSLMAGIVTGLCIYTRSTVIAFIPLAVTWLFFNYKGQLKKVLFNVVFIAIGISMVIGPWVLRNYAVHGKTILTTSADAEVFWRGNNINATGTSYTSSGNLVLTEDTSLYNKILSLNEMGQRDLFRREAMRFIRENPGKFVDLFFKKLYYFWWFSSASGFLYPPLYLSFYRLIYAISATFFVFGLYGIFTRALKTDIANVSLTILFLSSISIFQSFFYVEGRHRWGIESVFLIISSAGINSLFNMMKNKRGSDLI